MPKPNEEQAARDAISSFSSLSEPQQAAKCQIDKILRAEDGNPFVDIHELFPLYDVLYFRGLLSSKVEVSWSKRLTLCAGICEFLPRRSQPSKSTTSNPITTKITPSKPLPPVRLRLSEPLLQYRSRSDTLDTLLHECIHAYFFLAACSSYSQQDDGHGPAFLLLSRAINTYHIPHTNITIYHTFHDEVASYQTHIWQCSGPCRSQPPFFGLVKRAMNRPPGKSDSWYERHRVECGGVWAKIAGPEVKGKEKGQRNRLDSWVKKVGQQGEALDEPRPPTKRMADSIADGGADAGLALAIKRSLLECPICGRAVPENGINEHLDVEHPP